MEFGVYTWCGLANLNMDITWIEIANHIDALIIRSSPMKEISEFIIFGLGWLF